MSAMVFFLNEILLAIKSRGLLIMKEIYEMMLVFSVICLALGNSLPVQFQPDEKKEESEDNEIDKQVNKKVIDSDLKIAKEEHPLEEQKKCKYNFIVIRRHKSREYDSDMQLFQEYFSTKDKAKRTLLIIGKYFVIFYIVTGYIVGLDGEVPEVLFVPSIENALLTADADLLRLPYDQADKVASIRDALTEEEINFGRGGFRHHIRCGCRFGMIISGRITLEMFVEDLHIGKFTRMEFPCCFYVKETLECLSKQLTRAVMISVMLIGPSISPRRVKEMGEVKGRRRRIMNERTREDGERRTAVVTPRRPRVLLRLLCEARSEGREHVPNPLRRTEAPKRIINVLPDLTYVRIIIRENMSLQSADKTLRVTQNSFQVLCGSCEPVQILLIMDTLYTARLHGFPNLSRNSLEPTVLSEESVLSLLIVLGSSISLVGLVFAFITYSPSIRTEVTAAEAHNETNSLKESIVTFFGSTTNDASLIRSGSGPPRLRYSCSLMNN
ncbi:hypothetical protein GEV33_012188 [Tenebrio molitor]|uniref:Uncharacterized protein n=1 Tax=Tenebrio molitor TaxID=7067 RepID=A0A8J6H9J1_TENMO|nr:hypothetical protein GEV33_012188 [Tenebrio molitor]